MRYPRPVLALACVLGALAPLGVAADRPQAESSTRALRGTPGAQTQRLNETTPPPVEEIEERAMERRTRRQPPRVRAADPAADPAAVAQRGRWAELDVNGDGRVSRAEGDVDADFKANFEMLDADSDGFVTEDEYRAHARTGQGGRDR